jgi:membrane protease YdiL (CAAX protease family)
MKTIKAFVKRHPLLSFYALVFAISWGGVLIVAGPSGIPAANKEQYETLFPIAILAMVAGPSVAGILLTGLLYGRAGLSEFGSRLLKWRVGARWYAIALLTAPLLMTAILLGLSLSSPEFLPGILTASDKASVLLMGMFAGLMAGIFEELGWTGFAVPTQLRLRYGVLGTGLIVGIPWAVWHLLVTFWASGTISGEFALASYLLDPFLFLVAFRVLMVWVYDRSGGSLLVAGILMHLSLTASALILGAGVAGVPLLTFDLIWAVVLCVVIVAVAVANHGHLTRQPPLRRRVAEEKGVAEEE